MHLSKNVCKKCSTINVCDNVSYKVERYKGELSILNQFPSWQR